MMVDQHALTLTCLYDDVMMTTSVYRFSSNSLNPLTTKLGRITDHHPLILSCRFMTSLQLGHVISVYSFISQEGRPPCTHLTLEAKTMPP